MPPGVLDVLLIEDSDDDALLILRELRRAGYDPRHVRVDTESALEAALAARRWQVVISDFRMPALDFDTALRRVRQYDPALPVIIVSGALGEEQAVSAMRSGAQDYVLKDKLVRLGPAVERELREAEQRAAAARAEQERRSLEEQLRQAQKMEALGRLAGGVAHDFNNLLMVITGHIALLRAAGPRLETRDYFARLDEVAQSVDRAAALTRQLLAFSRRQVVRLQPLDLDRTVGNLEHLLQRLIGEDVDLTCELNAGGATVQADPHQIEQILMNLAVNARDAMPLGGKLTFTTSRERGERGEVARLQARDTGQGMDAATLARIFEPFFTTKDTGTGLGLSTVYGIVQQLNGKIWATSQPGQGATFTVELPCCATAPATPPAPPQPGHAGSETVMLLEDDERVRRLLAEMLRSQGYHVLSCATAADALAAAREYPQRIHLLITDVIMPRMSGQQVAAEVLRLRPSIRLLYISGYSDEHLGPYLAGQDSMFLQKPFTPEALAAGIEAALAS
ncbi:MAG: hybrid sensor histidine kinase/response regulator [Terriglobales bacterium]